MTLSRLESQQISELLKSGEFDERWYVERYPDVGLSNLSPAEHYIRYGKPLGRKGAEHGRKPRSVSVSLEASDVDRDNVRSVFDLAQAYSIGPIPSDDPDTGPLVSIIITNHNNADFLGPAVYSALSQTGMRTEIIVVDDGSCDRSATIINDICERFRNVKAIALLRNFGSYYARNMGVKQASGDFVAFLDSDDIMHPERIEKQVGALLAHPEAWGSRCRLRRWTADFSRPLTSPILGEVSLVLRREIFQKLGYFDTVRFGGDSEFRERLQNAFGRSSLADVPEELYFARVVGTSLTLDPQDGTFVQTESALDAQVATSRQKYVQNYSEWHAKVGNGLTSPAVSFPLHDRPFELGSSTQNASASLGVRRVATMATFPARREIFKDALSSIIDQVDELHIYFNDYDKIPDFPRDSRIHCYLGHDCSGDLKDAGKFYKVPNLSDCYIFTVDDDLIYPSDYVDTLIHYIEVFNRRCIVGAHGVIFPDEKLGYLDNRDVLHFREATNGRFVDLLGTGALGFHSSAISIQPEDFKSLGLADLWFAVAAHSRDVPLFAVPHESNWMKPLEDRGPKLYENAKEDRSVVDGAYHQYLRPLVEGSNSRRRIYDFLNWSQRGNSYLTLAGLRATIDTANEKFIPSVQASREFEIKTVEPVVRPAASIHFHVIVNGWNCEAYVWPCLMSLANQDIGNYTIDYTIVDDGSDDATFQKICSFQQLPTARVLRIGSNLGPAHARDVAIRNVTDPNTVIVLVDLDDRLEPDALCTVADRYLRNPDCMLTIGNWHDQAGNINPQGFYSELEIDRQMVREVELFNATALRTFRRKLYDAVTKEDLVGPEGEWLQTCTDVAIMYPLLDQCYARNVEFIEKPIYVYNRGLRGGTLARYGKPHKVERLNLLKARPRKPRFSGE